MGKYKVGQAVIIDNCYNPLDGEVVEVAYVFEDGVSYQIADPGFPGLYWYFEESELREPGSVHDVLITDDEIVGMMEGGW